MTTVINLRRRVVPEVEFSRIDRLTKYGNPFEGSIFGRTQAIALYRIYLRWVLENIDSDFLEPLRGRILGCWCKPDPCHGDVIIEMLG